VPARSSKRAKSRSISGGTSCGVSQRARSSWPIIACMALYKDVSDGSSLDDARLRWRRSIVVCRILEGDPTPKLELHDWFPQSAHGRALYSYVAYLPLGRRRYQRNPSWRDSRFPPHRRATCVWQGSQGRRRPGNSAGPGHYRIHRRINVHIGGIGASGTADQDGTCAQAGIDSAKDVLK